MALSVKEALSNSGCEVTDRTLAADGYVAGELRLKKNWLDSRFDSVNRNTFAAPRIRPRYFRIRTHGIGRECFRFLLGFGEVEEVDKEPILIPKRCDIEDWGSAFGLKEAHKNR